MLYYTMCFFASEEVRNVLILVVLDDALVQVSWSSSSHICSLNPCCAGRCSSTLTPNFLQVYFKESQSLLCWTML